MRVTREILLNLAHEQAAKLAAKDNSLQCIYLVGSLLHETPFLGGVTDIDLVCVHDRPAKAAREIVRINAEVHLDIAHYTEETYSPPRRLRTDAWIGGALDEGPLPLYDRDHWFDFTRASASAQYWQTEHIIARARGFAANARQTWQTLTDEAPQGLKRTQLYLNALTDLANAPAVLSGMPLTTRRCLLELPGRIEVLDIPEFTGLFVSQFSNDSVNTALLEKWQAQWLAAYDAVKSAKELPVQFCATRRSYYDKAISVLIPDYPSAALWILLTTWTEIAAYLPKTETLYKEWQSAMHTLELDSKGMAAKLASLDTLIDMVDGNIDRWQAENA